MAAALFPSAERRPRRVQEGEAASKSAGLSASLSNDRIGGGEQCGMVGHLTFQCRNFLEAAAPKPPSSSSSVRLGNY
jgi:hypothetical protein